MSEMDGKEMEVNRDLDMWDCSLEFCFVYTEYVETRQTCRVARGIELVYLRD